MNFDYSYALQILPELLLATIITFEATVGGMALALVLGARIAEARQDQHGGSLKGKERAKGPALNSCLERVAGGKPVPTFPRPPLEP